MTRIRSRDASHVQDRRGQGGGGLGLPGFGRGGGMGIPVKSGGGLLALLVVAAIFLLPRLLGGSDGSGNDLLPGNDVAGGDAGSADACQSDVEQILCGADNDVQDFWNRELPVALDRPYEYTDMVFFTDATSTACGAASAQVGPFYCPGDHLVYIDIDFLEQLQEQFGATGDLAAQYIVAHEFGHHIQNLTGQSQQPDNYAGTDNQWSVLVELQADCYAGVWAHDTAGRTDANGLPLFENPDEVGEAINAAHAVGDDRIQQQTQGRVDPSEFTHGTSDQRAQAFTIGYQSGDPASYAPRA